MKFSATLAILIAGGFLLLTTTINQTAADSGCSGKCANADEVKCYECNKASWKTAEKECSAELPQTCCCHKKCVTLTDAKGIVTSRNCALEESIKLGCVTSAGQELCVCEGNLCNKASTLLPAIVLVVMATAALCLTV